MTDDLPHPQPKSLGQILYELNPSIGWNPVWGSLDSHQRRWWVNYGDAARAYIIREAALRDGVDLKHSTALLPYVSGQTLDGYIWLVRHIQGRAGETRFPARIILLTTLTYGWWSCSTINGYGATRWNASDRFEVMVVSGERSLRGREDL